MHFLSIYGWPTLNPFFKAQLFNPFVPIALCLYAQGVEKGYIGNEWVNVLLLCSLNRDNTCGTCTADTKHINSQPANSTGSARKISKRDNTSGTCAADIV